MEDANTATFQLELQRLRFDDSISYIVRIGYGEDGVFTDGRPCTRCGADPGAIFWFMGSETFAVGICKACGYAEASDTLPTEDQRERMPSIAELPIYAQNDLAAAYDELTRSRWRSWLMALQRAERERVPVRPLRHRFD